MTATGRSDPTSPNHHGDHAGFHGAGGVAAALSMTVGRAGDARLAAELTGLTPGERVVDVGCGPGVAARHAARSPSSVVGVDPAAVMLRVAGLLTRERWRITYSLGAAEALPVDDGSADVLWGLATVHHWPDLGAALDEVRRVLAPGGRFLALERSTIEGATGHASHGWTKAQATAFGELCRDAGFEDVRLERRDAGRRSLVGVIATRP